MAVYQIIVHKILNKTDRTRVHSVVMANFGGVSSYLSPAERKNRWWKAQLQGVKENPWISLSGVTEFVLEKYADRGDWIEALSSAVRSVVGQSVQVDVSDVTRIYYGGLP